MTIFEELESEEVTALRDRYYELYGVNCGYHWNDYGSIEEYKDYMRKEIEKKEKELKIREGRGTVDVQKEKPAETATFG